MKKIYTNSIGKTPTTYYVDTIPNTKATERELVEQGMCLYNAKYADSDTLAYLGYMKDIVQPTHDIIARALLWSYVDYKIKVGSYGGFVSSLSITIDNNGIDKDVVLIKKWSTKLEDVYISFKDIEDLYMQCETSTQKTERVEMDICCAIKLYVRTRLANQQSEHIKNIMLKEKNVLLNVLPRFIDKVNKDIYNCEHHKEIYIDSPLSSNEDYWKGRIKTEKKRLSILTELKEISEK